MKKYITVIDPEGCQLGCDGTGAFIPHSHRALFETGEFYGYDSMQKLFPSFEALANFLKQASAQSVGASGGVYNLSWAIEGE